MNLCINCKYHHVGFRPGALYSPVMVCINENGPRKTISIDPVSGKKEYLATCSDERSEKGGCGPEGKHFEQQKEITWGEVLAALLKKLLAKLGGRK